MTDYTGGIANDNGKSMNNPTFDDLPTGITNGYSRISYDVWTKAKTQWERNKLRINVFIEDYSVELQTAAVIIAGVVLTDRIVRSNMSVKNELRWLRMDMDQDREFETDRRFNQQENIMKARQSGEDFTFYPGVGVYFPGGTDAE